MIKEYVGVIDINLSYFRTSNFIISDRKERQTTIYYYLKFLIKLVILFCILYLFCIVLALAFQFDKKTKQSSFTTYFLREVCCVFCAIVFHFGNRKIAISF